MPKLLSLKDAASYLGLSERHMRRLVSERRIAYVKSGRVWFTREDLDQWVKDHRIEAVPPYESPLERKRERRAATRRSKINPPSRRPINEQTTA
jgi:excisionase family DNA binding protein